MIVLSVAYPLLPVGPDSGGGAEQILYLLERGIVAAGHRSIVIAAKSSEVMGELIGTSRASGEITNECRRAAQFEHLDSIRKTLGTCRVDLIHFHGLDFDGYLPPERVPKLATLHLPPDWYAPSIFQLPELHLNCVSHTQAQTFERGANYPVVENGIELDSYEEPESERRHLLWIGRICPEKGVHVALEVAHHLDLPLIVAGPVHPFRYHEMYFSERVKPLLDRKRKYVGPVGVSEKRKLLAAALCLLIPSQVAETSSLVAMEAISSGTPVIAFRSGALPEIVDHGITGFVVNVAHEMAEAVSRISEISDQTCRAVARERFDGARMVGSYLKLYSEITV